MCVGVDSQITAEDISPWCSVTASALLSSDSTPVDFVGLRVSVPVLHVGLLECRVMHEPQEDEEAPPSPQHVDLSFQETASGTKILDLRWEGGGTSQNAMYDIFVAPPQTGDQEGSEWVWVGRTCEESFTIPLPPEESSDSVRVSVTCGWHPPPPMIPKTTAGSRCTEGSLS